MTEQAAGDRERIQGLRLLDFRPRCELIVPHHEVPKPRYPAVDVHTHLRRWAAAHSAEEELRLMDEVGVETLVDLDGYWGDQLSTRVEQYQTAHPGRFVIFSRVDLAAALQTDDPGKVAADLLRDNARRGACGLKIWKDFGLRIKDRAGTLVPIDDERLDELWQTAGELGLPVLIHVGDPAAFFRKLDAENERAVELLRHPDWHFYPGFPSLEEIIDQLERLVRRHPGTTFIGAHAGCYPENLERVGAMMDAAPNWHIDIAARIPELGRQPRAAKRLIEAHPDRVLFGTDQFGSNSLNPIYYRVLETEDEYFPYDPDDYPYESGFWHASGIGLSDGALRAVYRDNARRLLRLP